jgi:hypothetical protein
MALIQIDFQAILFTMDRLCGLPYRNRQTLSRAQVGSHGAAQMRGARRG